MLLDFIHPYCRSNLSDEPAGIGLNRWYWLVSLFITELVTWADARCVTDDVGDVILLVDTLEEVRLRTRGIDGHFFTSVTLNNVRYCCWLFEVFVSYACVQSVSLFRRRFQIRLALVSDWFQIDTTHNLSIMYDIRNHTEEFSNDCRNPVLIYNSTTKSCFWTRH